MKEENLKKQFSPQSIIGLNFFILLVSGFQTGIGAFLAIYLKNKLNWDPSQIGITLGIANFGIMLNQIPSGLLIDALKIKRLIAACACIILCITSFLITKFHSFHSIITIQFINGLACAIIPQIIAAISLGLVGQKKFPKRIATNNFFMHLGNLLISFLAGLTGYLINISWILYTFSIFSFSAIFSIFFIKPKEIDHKIARQSTVNIVKIKKTDVESTKIIEKILPIRKILTSKSVIIFLLCVTIFHFSSASQLTLISQLFVLNDFKNASIFLAAGIMISHLIMMFISIIIRPFIKNINRKPLLATATFITGIKSFLLTLSHNSFFLLSMQIIDGVSAGIYGVVSIIIIAELSKDSGRFNFIQGLIALAFGLGYTFGNMASGFIAHLFSFNVGFYSLALSSLIGFILILLFMPETRNKCFF